MATLTITQAANRLEDKLREAGIEKKIAYSQLFFYGKSESFPMERLPKQMKSGQMKDTWQITDIDKFNEWAELYVRLVKEDQA